MSSTPQFLWSLITAGPDAAFSEAEALFRVTEEAIDDVLDAIPPGFGWAEDVIKKIITSTKVQEEWSWFKRILGDTILLLVLALGTLFAIYLLA